MKIDLDAFNSFRQYIRLHDPEPPESLKDLQEIRDKHKEAQAYSIDKAKFSFFNAFYNQLQTTLLLWFDALPLMWTYAEDLLKYYGYTVSEHEVCYQQNSNTNSVFLVYET